MKLRYNKNDLGKSFALAVLMMLVGSFVLSALFGGNNDDLSFWIMQGLYQLFICSAAFIYAVLSKTRVASATAMSVKPNFAHVGWGCLITAFLACISLPVNDWFVQLIVELGFSEPSVEMPMQALPMVLVACIMPSFCEEVVFRGTISRSMESCPQKWKSLVVCGALFAVFHLNAAQTLHQFVLGMVLTLLVFRSGSLWTAAIVHLFNNLLAVLLSFTVQNAQIFTDLWYVFVPVGAVGFALSLWGYCKTTKSQWHVWQDEEPRDVASVALLVVSVLACVALWILNLVVA